MDLLDRERGRGSLAGDRLSGERDIAWVGVHESENGWRERERESGAGSGSSGAWDGTSGVFMPCLIKGGDVENTTTQKVAACVVRDFVCFSNTKSCAV